MGLGRIFKKVRKAFGKFKDKIGKTWNKLPCFAKVLLIGAVAWGAFALIGGAGAGISTAVPAVGEGAVAATGSFGAGGVAAAAAPAATGVATGAGAAAPGVLVTEAAGAVVPAATGAAAGTEAAAGGFFSNLGTGQALLIGQGLQAVGGVLGAPEEPEDPTTTFARPIARPVVTSQGVRSGGGTLATAGQRVPVTVSNLARRREEDRLIGSI